MQIIVWMYVGMERRFLMNVMMEIFLRMMVVHQLAKLKKTIYAMAEISITQITAGMQEISLQN